MNIPCYLIPALVGLICGILGYLLGKMLSGSNSDDYNYKSELDACNQKNSQLKSDIEILRGQINKPKASTQKVSLVSEPVVKASSKTAEIAFDAAAAKAAFGKKVKQDDLKIVEGIGPKIEELFKTSGILTWERLSETSVDRCNKILDKAGERYRIHDPGTWPRQAKLAYQGKWAKLKEWQDQLDGGREK